MMKAREEGAMLVHLVDEGVGSLFRSQMDGQAERARMALDLPFHGPRVGRFHETGTAAGDDVDAELREVVAEELDLVVDRIAVSDPRASEDRDPKIFDALGLNLLEIIDGLPHLINRLIEDVGRIARAFSPALRL